MIFSNFDKEMMSLAIKEALLSKSKDEVPVGAVLIKNDTVLSKGHNLSIGANDPTAHAEIIALRSACAQLKNYRLIGSTLYTTLEPCLMCFGAIVNARVKRLVIGALDEENGAPISNKDFLNKLKFNHQIKIESGLFSETCSEVLRNFFKEKRLERKLSPNRGMI